MPALLTPEQARAKLDREGISIAEFSRKHGLNKNLVSDLLNGCGFHAIRTLSPR